MIPIVGSSAPTPGSYAVFNDLNRNMVPKHKVYVQCVFSRKQPDIPTPLPTIPRFNEENSESRRNSSFSKARKDKGPKTSVFKSLERWVAKGTLVFRVECGDEILPSFMGIVINHCPIKQPVS